MKLFDSHCHIDGAEYDDDRDAVLQRAREAGVVACMIAGINAESAFKAVSLADSTEMLYASVGIHPHDAANCTDMVLEYLTGLAIHPRVCAWGEIGLDFNRMHSPKPVQEYWMARQLDLALELKLPLIFHERDTEGRMLEILRSYAPGTIQGVVHCFTGSEDDLSAYLDLGLCIGITGMITMEKRGAPLRRLISRIPMERMLIETDAPYLTPSPERNRFKRNEPAFVRSVFLKLMNLLGMDAEILAETLWKNTCRTFGIDPATGNRTRISLRNA